MSINTNVAAYPSRRAEDAARSPVVKITWATERNTLRLYGLAALILVWEIVSLFQTELFLPGPGVVAKSLYNLILRGDLLTATWDSFRIFAIGFLLAGAIGVSLGFLFARSHIAAI